MADLTGQNLNLFDMIKSSLETYGLGELASTLVDIVQEYGNDMPETINAKLRETEAYKRRFAGNFARIKAGLPALNESEYIYNERQYAETLKSYGQGDLATQANYAEFMSKDISPVELSQRFNLAVEKVQNADDALKKQLQKMYPGITDNDLARSLLMGKEGSNFLKNRIASAEILAEADTAGINSQLNASELAGQGVTREQARKGFGATADQLSGMTGAASRYGDKRSAADVQKALESENVLGIQSKKNRGLASQARSEFGGRSGLSKTGLSKKKLV